MASIISAGTTSGTSLNLSGDTSGVLQLASNGSTTAVTVTTAQLVGIGTTSPASKLQIGDATVSTTNGIIFGKYEASSQTNLPAIRQGSFDGAAQDLVLGASSGTGTVRFFTGAGDSSLAFGTTSNAERMRIDSSGNVGFGTTTPNSGIQAGTNVCIRYPTGDVDISHANGTASGTGYIYFGYNAGIIGSITQNGTTATAYNTSSDYRLKENIAPMTGALATVAQLKPVTYKWKVDGSDGQGFIAHELQEVVPDCVTGEKDAVDEQGKPIHQGIDTSFLVATLTAAIQELKAELDATKAEVQALKGTL